MKAAQSMKGLFGPVALMVSLGVVFSGCRGDPSREPPVHLIQNMDFQSYYRAQTSNDFFADGRAMRMPLEGTVARGELFEDTHLYQGKVGSQLATTLPMHASEAFMRRGQIRFGIYCAPCHGLSGQGDGIVIKRGLLPPPSFLDPRLEAAPIGHFFDVMTHGIRNMPSYAVQIPAEDRWAIAAYLRALQRSQDADPSWLPAQVLEAQGWSKQ